MDGFLLSIDDNKRKLALAHLVEHGFSQVDPVQGTRPDSPEPTVQEISDCICAGHYECTKRYTEKPKRSRHIIIFEDDCRFLGTLAADTIQKAVDFLDENYKWGSFHVGHVPLGLLLPLKNSATVWRSLTPFAAHCYVLNGETAAKLIETVPKSNWRRPYLVEGMRLVSSNERFAMFPSIAMQNQIPKELKAVLGTRITYRTGCRIMEGLTLSLTVAILVIFALLSFFLIRGLYRSSVS